MWTVSDDFDYHRKGYKFPFASEIIVIIYYKNARSRCLVFGYHQPLLLGSDRA